MHYMYKIYFQSCLGKYNFMYTEPFHTLLLFTIGSDTILFIPSTYIPLNSIYSTSKYCIQYKNNKYNYKFISYIYIYIPNLPTYI